MFKPSAPCPIADVELWWGDRSLAKAGTFGGRAITRVAGCERYGNCGWW